MPYFKAKIYQNRFLLGLRLILRWESLQSSPDSLAGFNLRGPTSKEGEGKGWEGKEGGRGRGEWKGRCLPDSPKPDSPKLGSGVRVRVWVWV